MKFASFLKKHESVLFDSEGEGEWKMSFNLVWNKIERDWMNIDVDDVWNLPTSLVLETNGCNIHKEKPNFKEELKNLMGF